MICANLFADAPAHPRAGGENDPYEAFTRMSEGSSPRGRGKRSSPVPRPRCARLIPARAGKTSPRRTRRVARWAHPRAGGENRQDVTLAGSRAGSSPRGRGKQACPKSVICCRRLIPARAGKTGGIFPGIFCATAHPRAGGENMQLATTPMPPPGSSPRGRGKPDPFPRRLKGRRLIPARAGKT